MEQDLDTFAAGLATHPEGFGGLFIRMGYMVLLPLLELPYPEVNGRLVEALTAAGVPESEAQAVSLRELVGFALQRASPYWAGQAVAWLEAGIPLDRELADAVDRRVADKRVWSQQLRHRAFGLVRRWERKQPES
jgi:hypothetical protein